ncbi:MAG: ParB/RepB/Spo0J family partition protein [Nitrososphaerales archaeon]
MNDIPISSIDRREMRVGSNVDGLVDSLSKHGQLSRIRIRAHPTRPGRYQVIFGNRRLAAAAKLGWKSITADVVTASDLDTDVMAFVENVDRLDVTDYEKAVFLERIHQSTGKSYSEIAGLIGKSVSYVSQHLSMLHLFPDGISSEEERESILRSFTEGHCRVLTGIRDANERWNTAKLAVGAKMGVRELERLARRFHTATNERGRGDHWKIREIITKKMLGLNSKDVRPFFESMSQRHFSMFSSFPPFNKMNREISREHICKILNGMNSFNASIENMEITFLNNKVAYAAMEVVHNFLFPTSKMTTRTRATIILRKEDEWKIVHEHWSTENPEKFVMASLSQVMGRRRKLALSKNSE